MAAGVDVRLGVEVAEVVRSAHGVAVRGVGGSVEHGSHVVVTVPLGVLKRGAPRFSPVLPPDRLAAIERLGFGRLEKVALRFDEPFWHAAGLPHMMLFPRDRGESTVWAIGQDAFGGRLLFAGEHTQSDRMSYADGAMTSGVREAKRLLRQPSVRLGPLVTAPG